VLGAASTLRSTPLRRAALAVALSVTAAAASQHPLPDGFGPLRFGSTVAQATAALPSLQPMASTTPGAAASLPVAYYRAENQVFDSLRTCVAILGFVADHFYEARLDCGRDAKVGTVLRTRFGTPTEENEQFAIWQNERTSISLNRTTMGFTLADRALTQSVHQLIIQKALSGGAAPPAAAPVTPAH